jgi:hypothetical protein
VAWVRRPCLFVPAQAPGHCDSESLDDDDPEPLESEDDELEDSRPVLALAPPSGPSPPPAPALRRWPASDRFFRGFFRSDDATNCSSARSVDGFSVSKSISIWNRFDESVTVVVYGYLKYRFVCKYYLYGFSPLF